MIRKPTSILVAILAAGLVLLPALVEAKAGRGGSIGSRGTRTYDAAPATPTAPSAAPVQRSVTPPATTQPQAAPSTAPRPATAGAPAAAAQPGFFNRPFMPALMGGLIGMGIGGLLFGGGLFGEGGLGAMGFGGIVGLLLQLALVFFIVRLAMNFFRNRQQQPAMAGGPQSYDRTPVTDIPSQTQARTGAMLGGGAAVAALQISDMDFEAFQQSLTDIQTAWSNGDLEALRSHVTPEMLGYFGRELSLLASQGLTNRVAEVNLEQGDLAESWSEDGIDYATVAMRWSALDYTTDASGKVVDGSKTERSESVETWTFLRANNGRWILSAIQQV
ncbi:Tim44 domain-containing protein [Ferrovibrio terrae]|uniref:Tim44 domain-containing protein n=1 Tax=Ferrovibrio terrae TaxID=2594003 RepID=A0A516GXG3_9PROT|nr:TIM44-like domain-containing protein [Ferrovibrio terrae]QDO96229.1 Tim44 domain-containing protein [Ferrovibrio terrae]